MTESGLRGIARYLAPGEEIRYVSRRHLVVLVKPFVMWLLTLLVVGSISLLLTQGAPVPILDTAGLIVSLAVTFYFAFRVLQWWKDRYVITGQRVLLIEGIISVKVTAVSLSRVTETSFARSLWGRIFGYGDLKLDSAGEQLGLATLKYLPKPEAQYRLITSLLNRGRDPGADRDYRYRSNPDPSEENTGPLPPIVL